MTWLQVLAWIGRRKGHPCIKHLDSYLEAKRQGFFLTAHAGEDGSDQNIWDAL